MPWIITRSSGEAVRCKTFTAGTRTQGRSYLNLMNINGQTGHSGPVEMRFLDDPGSFVAVWEEPRP